MLKQCADALKMCFFTNRLFSSSGLYPFKVLSQTLETDPPIAPHSAAPGLGIAVSPVSPLEQQGPVLSGESDKPRGTHVTIAGHRENQGVCLSSRKTGGTRTVRPHRQL